MEAERAGAYDAGLAGDLEPAIALHAKLAEDSGALARAAGAAFAGLIELALPELGVRPSPVETLEITPGPLVSPWFARAAGHQARLAALAFDAAGVARVASALEGHRSADPEAEAAARIIQAWRTLLGGEGADLIALDEVVKSGRRPELVLEASALRALLAEARGALPEALAIARRASRMSRTESLPQSEYLANLALARVRRIDDKPHLATRILSALYSVASAPWKPWLALELGLASGVAPPLDPELAGAAAPEALIAMVRAAERADRPQYDAATAALYRALRGAAFLWPDARAAALAIDPLLAADEALGPWLSGAVDVPPRGLAGLAKDVGPDAAVAWVLAMPGQAPRRLLGLGLGLARVAVADRLEPSEGQPKQLRTDSAVAALALAGPQGLKEEAFFQRLYGFPYEAERHQSVRDVLYLRVRKRVAETTLERRAGVVALLHERPLLVPDPRATPPPEMRILRVLAERKTAVAKEVAEELGIPVRTAQDALSRLAEDGALKKEKARAGLQYILEDTTFSEPTRVPRAKLLLKGAGR
ncbi:MAG: helix-turn-helix domain-containing protein [Myxococcota bacterium]